MNRASLTEFIVALVATIALVAGYTFWYFTVERVGAEAATTLSALAEKEAARARIATARAKLSELASEEMFVRAHFVPTSDVVPFLEKLEETGTELGAEVRVASVSEEKGTNGAITVSLSITGSFEEVMRSLGAIEHGPYAIRTENLSLSSLEDGAWRAVGSFRIGTRTDSEQPLP